MKKTLSVALVAAVTAMSLAACSGSSSNQATTTASGTTAASSAETTTTENSETNSSGETIVFKSANVGSDEHVYSVGLNMLNEKLKEKTNGRISINIFNNGALGAERDAIEGTQMGTIDMTLVTSDGAVPAFVADTSILSIPYLLTTREDAYKVLDEFLPEKLEPQFEENKLHLLGYYDLGYRHFTNNKKAVKSPDDMKGLMIRVQEAPVWFALCEALGAQATPVNFNELYTAMSQGTVDGQENPLSTIVSQKYYEVQKYLTLDGHTFGAGSLLINQKKWSSLSADDQAIIQECVNESIKEQRQYVVEKEDEYIQTLKDAGMQIEENPDIDAFVEATKDIGDRDDVKELFTHPELIQEVRDYLAK